MSKQFKRELDQAFEHEKKKHSSHIHTIVLIIVLIVSFIYQFFVLGDGVEKYITHTQDIFNGVYYTVFTALFFHAGIIHLLSNIFGIILFGNLVEKHIGWRMYLVFLGGGLFANVVSNLLASALGQSYGSLGASSGIASIIIFAILLNPFSLRTLLGWFLIWLDINGVTNPESTTNHLAHLSGYLSLLILYFFIEHHHRKKVITGFLINASMIVAVYILGKIYGLF